MAIKGQQPSPALIAAMRLIKDGANPYAAATETGAPPSRVYTALAKFNSESSGTRMKAALWLNYRGLDQEKGA